jgi:hypothetical protein
VAKVKYSKVCMSKDNITKSAIEELEPFLVLVYCYVMDDIIFTNIMLKLMLNLGLLFDMLHYNMLAHAISYNEPDHVLCLIRNFI